MVPSQTPTGWRLTSYGDVLSETDERAGERMNLPVLSVTKTRGLMLASERFGKTMHGRDLARYRIARRNQIVADPMLLWDGSIGLQNVVEAGLVSPDYRVYQPSTGVDHQFIGMSVRSPGQILHYLAGAKGTNVRRNRIARSDFMNIPLLLPPLGEQRKIAAILASIDEAIESTRAVIVQIQAVRKVVLSDLLRRGTPGKHTKFSRTEIGDIPAAWDIAQLSDVASIQTGLAKGKVVEDGVELPYLRVANVQDGFIDLSEVKSILVDRRMIARFSLQDGDVLFTEGGDADKLGRGSVWRAPISPCLHQNHVFAVRTHREKLRPEFLAAWAASPRGREYFLSCSKQTTNLASINSSQLKAFPVPIPPIEEQDGIVSTLATISGRQDVETMWLESLRAFGLALRCALLTGQVRVNPDEESA
jgi:type I restriction enzyme S subunit